MRNPMGCFPIRHPVSIDPSDGHTSSLTAQGIRKRGGARGIAPLFILIHKRLLGNRSILRRGRQ
jgi:hypothetical protein